MTENNNNNNKRERKYFDRIKRFSKPSIILIDGIESTGAVEIEIVSKANGSQYRIILYGYRMDFSISNFWQLICSYKKVSCLTNKQNNMNTLSNGFIFNTNLLWRIYEWSGCVVYSMKFIHCINSKCIVNKSSHFQLLYKWNERKTEREKKRFALCLLMTLSWAVLLYERVH